MPWALEQVFELIYIEIKVKGANSIKAKAI